MLDVPQNSMKQNGLFSIRLARFKSND